MATRQAIGGWTARPIGDLAECPAALRHRSFALGDRGCVHEALERAGAIVPIDRPGGEESQEWVGRVDWEFAASFHLEAGLLAEERIDLLFEVIDTVAEIRLNGCRVGITANESVPLRLPVRAWLRRGRNDLAVRFRGPLAAVEALERRMGARPVNGDWTPFPFLRKCASNFGWDWGPHAATVGIEGAAIEAWSGTRIAGVRPLVVACSEAEAIVEVHVRAELAGAPPATAHAALSHAASGFAASVDIPLGEDGRGAGRIHVPGPSRWWPRGHGQQPLYQLAVGLDGGGPAWHADIGLRSVRLLQEPDRHGSRFAVEVNGREVWCRGANWVPRRPCPRRDDAIDGMDLVEAAIDAADEAGLTMLRVWGGGIYESDRFYQLCDRRGILVWQDFLFACATYPEDAPYPDLVEAEARHQVERLSRHPSVVLWCGGNEDILAWWSWGWKERLRPGQSWGRRYWLELLPQVVAELDPTRPYWPESPYSGSMQIHPNDPDHGDRHTWDAKLEAMRTIVPRFCSEFGHQSPPCWGSIRELLEPNERWIGNPELARRQRAWGGDAFQYGTHLAERFRPLEHLEEWVFAAQLLQARSYRDAILWMRANAPRCMGALFWQLNDVWTGHSWSVLDARLRRKPAWHAVREACRPEALAILPPDVAGGGRVVLCRAAGECPPGVATPEVTMRLVRSDGEVLRSATLHLVDQSPWLAAADLPSGFLAPDEPARSLLVADWLGGAEGCRATHRFVPDLEFIDARPEFDLRVDTADGCWEIAARALLRDVCIAAPSDRFEGDLSGLGDPERVAGDGMRTLLPGERWRLAMPDARPRAIACARSCVRLANELSIAGASDPARR